jgi:hypothetical protein
MESFLFTYLTITEPTNELKKRNARFSGRKTELIERFID